MLIHRIASRQIEPNRYFNTRQTKQDEPSPSQPDGTIHSTYDTIQRVGCSLAGAITGAVIGAGSAVYTLRHAPAVVGDCLGTGFFEHRSGPTANPPGNPLTDCLRDCANAALYATVGIPFAATIMAGGLVAVPLLFAVGGAYEGAQLGTEPCEVAKEILAGGSRYDNWWAESHEDYLTRRAEDKRYDAEYQGSALDTQRVRQPLRGPKLWT